jgi:iron complex outermembrane receptor protein
MVVRFRLSQLTIFVMVLLVLACGSAFAQPASIKGKVTDAQTGEALPGANVVVTSAGGAMTGAAAGSNGTFEVKGLSAGTYVVSVSYIGYQKKVMAEVSLAAGETKTLDLSLAAAGIDLDAVVVSASRQQEKILAAPAAISVLEAAEMRHVVSPSAQAVLTNITGVDMAKTGIDREEIVLRGFNNAFSGAAYVLTDYRQAAVASLGVNLHSIMPNASIDLERVEVVRGPGSALYGPGVDAGVIHYITKSPFTSPGTSVSLGGGERSSYYASFRQAGILGSKVGYKITGQFAKADDWELNPYNPLDQVQLLSDVKPRNYDYEKYNFNGMLQYRLSDRTSLTANGGFSSLDATVLSGIGTVQAIGFGYTYGQLRLQSGNFFAQTYLNRNNAGDSFVYGTGQKVEDASRLINAQAQYDFSLSNNRHKVIVGADMDITTPDTKGTIYGRNEDSDQIKEYGGYLQATLGLTPKLDLTFAARGDYNNVQEDFQISPRVAAVLKASSSHTLRATYNRAFSSPGNNSLFLDIIAAAPSAALPLFVRGRGAAYGYNFERNAAYSAFAGTDLVATSLNPATLGAKQPVGLPLNSVYGSVYAGIAAIPIPVLKTLLPAPLNQFPDANIAALVALLSPTSTNVQGFSRGVLGLLDLSTRRINPIADVANIDPLKPTISSTFEAGYKGLFGNRVLFAIDGYYTQRENFVGPLLVETPFVLVPTLLSDLTAAMATGIDGNAVLKGALAQAGITPQAAAAVIAGLASRSLPSASTPVALVVPTENDLGVGKAPELLLTYRNFGKVDFYGVDVSVQVIASSRLNFFGNISYVSDDFFDNEELEETNTSLAVALNAPTFKFKTGFNYAVPRGISVNASGRYADGFPVRSGPYIGDVRSYFLLDVGAGYDLGKFAPGMSLDVTVQNVLDNEHREFIGAPLIGRLALARLNYTF